jgi:hypothetical protein
LARFAQPLVPDTINALSFDVYVKIMEGTGALLATPAPKMLIQTILSNGSVLYDTIPMQYNSISGLWVAHIPQQYYGSSVLYSVTVADTASNVITLTGRTYLQFTSNSEKYTGYNLSIASLSGLVDPNNLCTPDFVTLSANIANSGTSNYNFAINPIGLHVRVTTPVPFSLDTVIIAGSLASGQNRSIDLTNAFPLIAAGQYDIKVWLESSLDTIAYDDTLLNYYISGKFGLPIDVDFSSSNLTSFSSTGNNSLAKWEVITQGTGADTVVKPQFGTGILAFSGSRGAMTTLATGQMDLSRTTQPALSFWYFHDTIPSKDYTDVRITIDGGATYNTLFSLTKYNSVYGWKQYSANLPSYAVNQCVILVFEAMEKSVSADVTQYIDRILITARQDIAVSEVIIPPLTACDMSNKEIKVVMENLSDPALNYVTTPTDIVLEIAETGQKFTVNKTSGSLGSFASDTITMATGFDFTKGTYTFKAYFSSVLDVDRQNDTLVEIVVVNPAISVVIAPESGGNTACLSGETDIRPTITIYNTDSLTVFGFDMKLYVQAQGYDDTLTGTETTTLLQSGDSLRYQFASTYTVPWIENYGVIAEVSLQCDPAVHDDAFINECVDINDLVLDSILNPSGSQVDATGSNVTVSVSLRNRGNQMYYNVPIKVRIDNSQGIEQSSVSGSIEQIDILSDTTFIFATAYTVPDDTVYSITVYVANQDNYKANDTLRLIRRTDKVGISTFDGQGISLSQNIPNPANDNTVIPYSIPSDGSVTFNVYSISGQILYSQTVETTFGAHSIELNTSDLAAGMYFYSMEFKGQRIVKRMVVEN